MNDLEKEKDLAREIAEITQDLAFLDEESKRPAGLDRLSDKVIAEECSILRKQFENVKGEQQKYRRLRQRDALRRFRRNNCQQVGRDH